MASRVTPARRQKAVTALAALDGLNEAELRQRWAECYGQPPPARLSRALLLRAAAYYQQTQLLGGLSGYLRRRLVTMAGSGPVQNDTAVTPLTARLMPGAQLVREWQGAAHRVQVTEAGFEYLGDVYRSLSKIARQITGTSWSGPAFFGLRNKAIAKHDQREVKHG